MHYDLHVKVNLNIILWFLLTCSANLVPLSKILIGIFNVAATFAAAKIAIGKHYK